MGGVLFVVLDAAEFVTIWPLPTRAAATTQAWAILLPLWLVAICLVLLSLVGVYGRQVEASGTLGLVGFLVAFAGTMLVFGFFWAGEFVVPALSEWAPDFLDLVDTGQNLPPLFAAGFMIQYLLLGLSWFLIGLASFRAMVLPRWASLLMMIASVLIFVFTMVGLPFGEAIFGIAVALLGYPLWAAAGNKADKSLPAT